jgi:hypothetical protein
MKAGWDFCLAQMLSDEGYHAFWNDMFFDDDVLDCVKPLQDRGF